MGESMHNQPDEDPPLASEPPPTADALQPPASPEPEATHAENAVGAAHFLLWLPPEGRSSN